MKRFSTLFYFLSIFICLNIKAQNSIQLITIGDISSIDLGAIYIANSLSGQPRFFQLVMNTQPIGRKVFLKGKIEWKENLSSGFKEVANFTTNIFNARNIFSDELGNSDIKFANVDGDKDLIKQIAEIGKPKGVIGITIQMFSESNDFLDDDYQELIFLNPTSTFYITQPNNNEEIDIGNVICSWTSLSGVIGYKIKANILENESQSLDEALNSSNPIIDNYDVGNETIVNLSKISKNREWFDGQKVVVVVIALINESGVVKELKCEPIVFKLKSLNQTVNIYLQSIVDFFSSIIPNDLINKINSGELKLDQIEIRDENGIIISYEELSQIINMLEARKDLIINTSFQPK